MITSWVTENLEAVGLNCAIVIVPVRGDAQLHATILKAIRDHELTPVLTAAFAMNLIARERPELKGCKIYSIAFDAERVSWRIGIAHDSLPLSYPDGEAVIMSLKNTSDP